MQATRRHDRHADLFEAAADAYLALVEGGQVSPDEAIDQLLQAPAFAPIARRIRRDRLTFIEFAWQLCG